MLLTTRRSLLAGASVIAATPRAAWAQTLAAGAFTHGVASGDPLPDGVILWTRFAPASGSRIAWEISEDETFGTVMRRGEAEASPVNDYCVKVDVRGLLPGRAYCYRFLSASGPSLAGLTRTAPESAQSLTVGLVSCANYGFGYFHAYAHLAARDDIDLVLHTGDYIYEYGLNEYPSTELTVPGRAFDPAREIVTLDDYYARYRQYHTDPDLLELRRRKPIAAVWDDHEITNDASATGAQNHQENEGAYVDRVAAATKAYFDWMPIRRPEAAGARVYRSLDWGDLARVLLIDTRLIGRTRQLDYRSSLGLRFLLGGVGIEQAAAEFRRTQLEDPTRTLLGAEQEAWLAQSLAQSKQRGHAWQIVAQQIAMGEQLVGAGASAMVAPETHANTRRFVAAGERLGALGMPWNLDAWDGYPAARTRFLEACAAHGSNVAVLGGDSHNTWVNNLTAPNASRLAAIEFAGASVTSPGLERPLSAAAQGAREAMMRNANPQLAYCDVTHRGYGALKFTPEACDAEWVAFADVRSQQLTSPTITRMTSVASQATGPGAWSVQNN
jgi:alkaline phosphatase D